MDTFSVPKTENTPAILLDPVSGELKIEGRSYTDDAVAFYDPVFNWIDKYCEVPLSETKFIVDCDYLNTSSYKCIIKILNKLKEIQDAGKSVALLWFYEDGDDDYKDAGEDLKGVTPIPVEIKMK